MLHLAQEQGISIAELLGLTDGYDGYDRRFCFFAERLLSYAETEYCNTVHSCTLCSFTEKRDTFDADGRIFCKSKGVFLSMDNTELCCKMETCKNCVVELSLSSKLRSVVREQ